MGDRFNNSNGLPMASEDSEEFLTILGKKMGKLVKGGNAEPWRNDFLLLDYFFCEKALIADSVACDDWTILNMRIRLSCLSCETCGVSTDFNAFQGISHGISTMCVVFLSDLLDFSDVFRTSTPRLASSSTTGSAGAFRTSPRRRSCWRPKRTRPALAEPERHHLGPQGTFQRKQRSRRFRASTSSMRRTLKSDQSRIKSRFFKKMMRLTWLFLKKKSVWSCALKCFESVSGHSLWT